jgi:hypothetical protein
MVPDANQTKALLAAAGECHPDHELMTARLRAPGSRRDW